MLLSPSASRTLTEILVKKHVLESLNLYLAISLLFHFQTIQEPYSIRATKQPFKSFSFDMNVRFAKCLAAEIVFFVKLGSLMGFKPHFFFSSLRKWIN